MNESMAGTIAVLIIVLIVAAIAASTLLPMLQGGLTLPVPS